MVGTLPCMLGTWVAGAAPLVSVLLESMPFAAAARMSRALAALLDPHCFGWPPTPVPM